MSLEKQIPAAKYFRMSAERQQYSLMNQSEVIAKYAECHGFQVVKTYSDEAKTGVSFRLRRGLQTLIQDVVKGIAPYKSDTSVRRQPMGTFSRYGRIRTLRVSV